MKIKRIKIRIVLYFSAGFIFIILLIAGISTYLFSTTMISQIRANVNQNVKMIDFELHSGISMVYDLQRQIISNSDLNDYMKMAQNYKGGPDKTVRQISELMREYSYKTIFTNSILIFNRNGIVLDPFYHMDPYKTTIEDNNDFYSFVKSEKFRQFSPPSIFPMPLYFKEINGKKNIAFYVQYLDNENFRNLGYLAINIRNSFLFENIEKHYSDIFDEILIYDKQGNSIFSMTDKSFYFYRGSRKYLVFEKNVTAYPDWTIAVAISNSTFFAVVKKVLISIYLISIVSFIMAILISFYISSNVSVPIDNINSAINYFKCTNNWPDPVTCRTEDEMSYLVNGINELFISMKKLVTQIHEEHEEKKMAEIKAVQLQLQLLQSQINPHFIHNTLNAIECIALERKVYDLSEMINSLNILFRNSMAIENIYNTVADSIRTVEAYIKIMKIRYGDSFNYRISVDESLRDCLIPKLLMQPVVENALFHGLQPKTGLGLLTLAVTDEDGMIVIRIEDDGVGINEHTMKNNLKKDKSGLTGIGMSNIVERLKYCYNGQGGIEIFTQKGVGTTVVITLPKKPFKELQIV